MGPRLFRRWNVIFEYKLHFRGRFFFLYRIYNRTLELPACSGTDFSIFGSA